jgi:hypothetical protein
MKHLSSLAAIAILSFAFTANVGAQERNGPPGKPDFSTIDADSDGVISYEEFSAKKPPNVDDVQSIFDEIDTDGNGEISEDEFENHTPPQRRER